MGLCHKMPPIASKLTLMVEWGRGLSKENARGVGQLEHLLQPSPPLEGSDLRDQTMVPQRMLHKTRR